MATDHQLPGLEVVDGQCRERQELFEASYDFLEDLVADQKAVRSDCWPFDCLWLLPVDLGTWGHEARVECCRSDELRGIDLDAMHVRRI